MIMLVVQVMEVVIVLVVVVVMVVLEVVGIGAGLVGQAKVRCYNIDTGRVV